MAKQAATRQRWRKALIIGSLLLFPVILNYLSPYVILAGASEGVVNGSFIAFVLMFISALFVGRLWCGWACPAGGLQEVCFAVNNGRARGGKFDWIKWVIWIPWLALIAFLAIQAGGYQAINPLFLTDSGISVDRPEGYIIYYMVIGILVILALAAGRRAACHYICWMAPFMILGRRIRNLARWPSLRLRAAPETCSNCLTCTRNCPMSLEVNEMVQRGQMENDECILCGTCVDGCPKDAIRFSFSSGR